MKALLRWTTAAVCVTCLLAVDCMVVDAVLRRRQAPSDCYLFVAGRMIPCTPSGQIVGYSGEIETAGVHGIGEIFCEQ